MTSARAVAMALVMVASSIASVLAQARWPGEPPQPTEGPWPGKVPWPVRPSQPPIATQQECMTQFTALRSEVEKRGVAARAASEKAASREEMCGLVKAYGAAETRWIKFAEAAMAKCGIPTEIVAQMRTVHARTTDGEKKLCAAGPAAAPTLHNALDAAPLPSRRPNGPGGYCWDPPVREIDYQCLPRFSGR